ncbi:cache domain-containing sensor histidine kinase [Paenibacillus hamazuiensis]|uniref:cache domain-containing sensor histidine kinase n=1 Tax=Paenibacillus hamazuiensis TaxID=2936508 RepID=UPI00200F0C23|nr:sensor histidine kinase [Paenibacillus hamazuiensis]
MKSKLFVQNLLQFLVPLLIPIIILGTLCSLITKQYIQGELNRSNAQLFGQIDRNVEMIFNDMNGLKLKFGSPEIMYRLEQLLRAQRLTLDNLRLLETVQNDINVAVNSKPYIESVYVYVRNDTGQFLASGEGLAKFDRFHDVEWMDNFVQNQDNRGVWTEQRQIRQYSFQKPVAVTTFYKNLYSVLEAKPVGVIVLNVYSDYIEKLLHAIETYPGQAILIADERKRIILKSRPLDSFRDIDWNEVVQAKESFTLQKGGESYYVSTPADYSNQYGWTYYSVAAQRSLNQIPFRLGTFTLICVLLSFLLGLALTYWLTKQNLRHVRNMVSIIQSAENGLPLPELKESKGTNEYDFITQKLIKNFIEQSYLQIQLSEKKYRLQALELSALQSQMNPHFLFNTLETIYWVVLGLTGKPNKANHMLEHLSNLLKYSLGATGKIVTLEQEISYTKSYLEIQKIRYRDLFDIVWEYDPRDIQHYKMLKLTLQPLVENSIYHGIKERGGKSWIKIKIITSDTGLRITVVDNGLGMKRERLIQVRGLLQADIEPSEHIGLVNTNRRLKLAYGQDGGLVVRSKRNWGTSVSFSVPLQRETDGGKLAGVS